MYQTTVGVDRMMCGMCEAHVNDAVRKAFPVKKVTSSMAGVRPSSSPSRRSTNRQCAAPSTRPATP